MLDIGLMDQRGPTVVAGTPIHLSNALKGEISVQQRHALP